MDETVEVTALTVGQRLREAREARKLSVEEIAASTRIPTRHLLALENSEWDKLPAATYSIGFAKNYAGAVGLDRTEIGDALREEMGGSRPIYGQPEVYEAADPARSMPKGLVIGALILLALVVAGLMWARTRSLEADPAPVAASEDPLANAAVAAPTPVAAPLVSITAKDRVWVDIRDGQAILKQGELAAGERYDVPAEAIAPTLTTSRPEALQIMVGDQAVAAVGPAGQRASDVSLKGEDLLKAPAASTAPVPPPPAATAPAAAAPKRPASRPAAPKAQPPVQPAPEPAATTASGGNSSEQANITE